MTQTPAEQVRQSIVSYMRRKAWADWNAAPNCRETAAASMELLEVADAIERNEDETPC